MTAAAGMYSSILHVCAARAASTVEVPLHGTCIGPIKNTVGRRAQDFFCRRGTFPAPPSC